MQPIFRLIIPILFGMIGANYCFKFTNWNNSFILTSFAIVGITTIILYFSSKKEKKNNGFKTVIFLSFAYLLFALFGFIIMLHSIKKAQDKYGENWSRSVYKENPFTINAATDIQKSIVSWYSKHNFSGQEGAIIEAITIGAKEHLNKETKKDFSRAGVSHLLALSGFHVGFIYIMLQIVFMSRIINIRWRWASQFAIILCLWGYAFITGMSPSLLRAVTMCTILTISSIYSKEVLPFNALALSALLMICLHPIIINHVGFQLSYISMIGIYLLGIPLSQLYTPYCFIDKFLWCTISISISCTLFTLPIVSHTFGNISLMSIPANIITTVLTYLIFLLLPLLIITAVVYPALIPHISNLLMSISHQMLQVTNHISHHPLSSISTTFTIPYIILYYSLLTIITVAFFKQQIWKEEI